MAEPKDGGKLVLVVDEIPAVIRMLELELGIQGFRVTSSLVGPETYARVEELKPDIILLEVILPGMSGIDMMQGLRERFEIPIVFLTTQGSDADRLLAFEMGAADYIEKPFDPVELGQRLASLLNGTVRDESLIVVGELRIDLRRQLASRLGMPISLTTNEWTALMALSLRPRQHIPSMELIQMMWGEFKQGWDVRLRHLITRLQEKIEADPHSPQVLVGDWNEGWSLSVDLTTEL